MPHFCREMKCPPQHQNQAISEIVLLPQQRFDRTLNRSAFHIRFLFYQQQKPGEVLYADLSDLNPRQVPKKSTHPEPVPTIKRPAPYARTDYAEITHFIKADDTELQEVWPRNGQRGSLKNMQLFI